ncbi:MAG TPA: PQQ-binding-like beta-propeller repeat protein [Candidatus Polarisedimenticolia bacterium]|nr:PQQ-binding-like beta-propeller repeat protein [Candidatus Polarisedimenticolia bacterium]
MKVSGAGVELWRAVYDSPGRFEMPAGIVVDDEERTYVGGTTSVRQPEGWLLTSAFIVSYDADGQVLWQDEDFGKQDRETVYDIVRDPASGAIYLAGELDKNFGGLGRESPWLVRYDPDGRRVWEKHYRKPGAIAFAQKAAVGPDGNVVLAGFDSSGGPGFQVIKVDAASGKELWTAVYARPTEVLFVDVAVDGSGNVLVTSNAGLLRYTPDGDLSWSVAGNFGTLAVDASGSAYVQSGSWRTSGYDATGQRIWTSVYDPGDPQSTQTLNDAPVITPAGDMIVAGGSRGDIRVLSYRLP